MNKSSDYSLGYSEEEARRLEKQAAFLEDLTEDVFRRGGIEAGMQVLDLGCGAGDVSFLASRMVGATGGVLGLDRSASSVELARQRALARRIGNVQFEVAELDNFDTARSFDAVIGRLVLVYLPDPSGTLRHIRKFLKPNGVIAFQEVDAQLEIQVPASPLFSRTLSWLIEGFKASGADPFIGSNTVSTSQ